MISSCNSPAKTADHAEVEQNHSACCLQSRTKMFPGCGSLCQKPSTQICFR